LINSFDNGGFSMSIRKGYLLVGALATWAGDGCQNDATKGGQNSATASAPGAAPKAAGRVADPCTVLTEKDATTVFGSDPGPGHATVTAAGTGRCTYDTDSANLMITITPNQDQATFTRAHDKAAKDARPGSFGELPEVAHGAYGTWGGPMASIQFYKGSTAVYILLTMSSQTTPPKSQVTALAAAAAGRV
jgi:hypothetical protein